MEKLPEDFKKKWVAALRSGEYKQGRDKLHNAINNTFCCLGVACHIAGITDDEISDYCYTNLLAKANPDRLPAFFQNTVIESPAWNLAAMNDGGRKSFLEIADYIEENL